MSTILDAALAAKTEQDARIAEQEAIDTARSLRDAAEYLTKWLKEEGVTVSVVAPIQPLMGAMSLTAMRQGQFWYVQVQGPCPKCGKMASKNVYHLYEIGDQLANFTPEYHDCKPPKPDPLALLSEDIDKTLTIYLHGGEEKAAFLMQALIGRALLEIARRLP